MLEEDTPLPAIVQRDESGKAWLCSQSIEQKLKVFCLQRGNVQDYIDLSKLVNAAGTGVVQRMMPLEQEVFSHAHEALERVRKRKGGARSLRKYYEWVDEFVKKNYPSVIQTQDDDSLTH